ncbi:MAG: GNAT family N-acetyltransferase [Oscillospiraceae bacterium]|nr:GNAT family N-acetyltransferase [Oscillospiraceae bacterium]
MEIRRTHENDLEKVMDIYKTAREFMAQSGNPNQWGNNSPDRELVQSDIKKDGYVVVENDEVIGVFVLSDSEETYYMIDGNWLNDEPYGVIHRLATGGTRKGAGQFVLDWCLKKAGNIRIDTHEDNAPMLKLLEKNGYKYCGKISYGIRGERLAFQKIKE